MRKKMLAFTAALVVAVAAPLFGGVTPAAAHVGHTSCEGGILALLDAPMNLPQGPGTGPSGAAIAFIATGGPPENHEVVALAHAIYCEPAS